MKTALISPVQVFGTLSCALLFSFALLIIGEAIPDSQVHRMKHALEEQVLPKKALATYQYQPTGGNLAVGIATSTTAVSLNSWRGAVGNDTTSDDIANYWVATRTASGLDMQLQFDGILLSGANKMLIAIEDTNWNTATGYLHQICDWTSSTGVNDPADANCTGGGWRTLHPRRTLYTTNGTDTTRRYEIYNGYFQSTSTAPGTARDTPLDNFVSSSNDRVLIRAYSTSTVGELRIDWAQVEVAIDPFYEPSGMATTSAGVITGFVSDLTGARSTNLTPSDNAKMVLSMPAVSQPIDAYFTFNNVKTLEGMNTILVQSEHCITNLALDVGIYLFNFDTSSWTLGATTTDSVCATDAEVGTSFNNTLVPGFALDDYILDGEVRVRFLTNRPGVVYNVQLDALYIMVGSVNTDTSLCEISFGTGTETDCDRTRSMAEAITATPTTTTWQVTSELEYPADHHPLDNDDDGTGAEYAKSQNLSFPLSIGTSTSITAIHYAAKFRSNIASMTSELQMKNYSGTAGLGGETVGAGWINTPGIDTNAATTYNYYDTRRIAEFQASPADLVDTVNNRMNLRLRTSVSTNVASATVGDWDFAMVSARWVEEPKRVTIQSQFGPTNGLLVTGTATNTTSLSLNSWRGAVGNDSITDDISNYWVATRTASGLDMQLEFDGVEIGTANKMIVTIEDSNWTSSGGYVHQICDWVSGTGVTNVADSRCTGGGWRTLHPREIPYTNNITDTTRNYEIYDGYFSSRAPTQPGAAYSTPLTNFASSTNDRVLIRAYATSTAGEFRLDWAQVEVAVDPVYEVSAMATSSAGVVTNFISDLVGGVSTNLTGSDAVKLTIPMPAINQRIDAEFTFPNVRTYDGANTILVVPEACISNAALDLGIYLYNFTSASWTLGATTTDSVCATDAEYAISFNDTLVPGFDINDYIQAGEVKMRFLTNAPGVVYNLQLDRIYMMVGSVNTDTALCEISFGTGTETNCDRTRSTAEAITATPVTTTWQATSELEYPADQHPFDNDDDGTGAEHARSQNLSFPISIATSSAITGIHYAAKYRSGTTTLTSDLQMKNYGTASGIGGEAVGSGWTNTPGADTVAAATYGYFDSWRLAEYQVSPEDMVDTLNGYMNLRLRTSVSTNVLGAVSGDWDFAMASIRYVDKPPRQSITFSLSDNSVGFGTLSSAGARYATGDRVGSSADQEAHRLRVSSNAGEGYVVSIDGTTLTCAACGATIEPIGDVGTTSLPGTEQFGLRTTLVSGSGTTTSPYDGVLWAFATTSFPDQVASGGGDGLTSVFGAHYISNIGASTEAGAYDSVVTYTVTSTY